MQKIIDFMLERIGGEENLKKEFLKNKLSALNVLEMTASELMREARSGGWDNWLRDLTLEEFQSLIKSAIQTDRKTKKTGDESKAESPLSYQQIGLRGSKTSHKRIEKKHDLPSKDDHVEHRRITPIDTSTTIIDFIRTHAWSHSIQIAENLNLMSEETERLLGDLVQKGWIKAVGTSRDARYALA